jgi:hypothetical protein
MPTIAIPPALPASIPVSALCVACGAAVGVGGEAATGAGGPPESRLLLAEASAENNSGMAELLLLLRVGGAAADVEGRDEGAASIWKRWEAEREARAEGGGRPGGGWYPWIPLTKSATAPISTMSPDPDGVGPARWGRTATTIAPTASCPLCPTPQNCAHTMPTIGDEREPQSM